jgi:hypothetical protein
MSPYRFENFLKVYVDGKNNQNFYNLLRGINLFSTNNKDLEDSYYTGYHDTWAYLSYKHYNTIDLWWLICAYNQIEDPTKLIKPGTEIKILKKAYIGTVLDELKSQINK